jgi:cytochrome c biogenesis protein CcmG, thiol:disulfide interchange protein DsbE
LRVSKWMAMGLATAVLAAAGTGCDRGNHPGQIGKIAPEFALNDGTQSVDLAKLRGHVVVLVFWATWCGPCIQELPSLTAMQQALPQVNVVTVSADEDADAYRAFMQQHQVQLFSIHDGPNGANMLYGSVSFPETFVIDKDGVIRRKFIGAQDWSSPEIVDFLRKLAA